MRESLRLFSLCDATRWCVLPVAGGWYDQHPVLIEQWYIIFSKKAEHDRQESEAQKRKANTKGKKGRRR